MEQRSVGGGNASSTQHSYERVVTKKLRILAELSRPSDWPAAVSQLASKLCATNNHLPPRGPTLLPGTPVHLASSLLSHSPLCLRVLLSFYPFPRPATRQSVSFILFSGHSTIATGSPWTTTGFTMPHTARAAASQWNSSANVLFASPPR